MAVAMKATLALLALSTIPVADPQPVHPNTFFCQIVNSYVDQYGEKAAEQWAREHKWSEIRIAEAKKCRPAKTS